MKREPVDIAAHEKRLHELADRIVTFAARLHIPTEDVRRPAFEEGDRAWLLETQSTFFARSFWGPAKEIATRGKVEAPPLDAIPAGHRVKGVSTLIGKDGGVKQQWVKTQETHELPEDVIARMVERLPTLPARAEIEPPRVIGATDVLAVYPLGDPHVGMLAWARESGASFDLGIAESLLTTAARDLVMRGPDADQALIVNLGDFFHFDNDAQKTTRGNHTLDVDGRNMKVYEAGLRIFTSIIDAALSRHSTVTVDNVAGNHDANSAQWLALCLRSYYRDNPRVSIEVDPAPRHYHRFGANLIGTTHGDRGKMAEFDRDMSAERAKDWGETQHRIWLVGHVHHSTVKEVKGCTIETFRTLAARDSWHAGQGYAAMRDMHRLAFHKRFGLISREIAGLGYLRELGAKG